MNLNQWSGRKEHLNRSGCHSGNFGERPLEPPSELRMRRSSVAQSTSDSRVRRPRRRLGRCALERGNGEREDNSRVLREQRPPKQITFSLRSPLWCSATWYARSDRAPASPSAGAPCLLPPFQCRCEFKMTRRRHIASVVQRSWRPGSLSDAQHQLRTDPHRVN